MGLSSDRAEQNINGLKIEDGIITKCLLTEGEVTLPDDFEGVAKNAFDGCENVMINYSSKYIQKKLEKVIVGLMEDIEDAQDDEDDYVPAHILRVYHMTSGQIEEAISEAVAVHKEQNEWKVIVVDADKISDTNPKVDTNEGYGILFIKNLNVDNVANLPRNFIYNLVKSHSFNYANLSPDWLVIIEVGRGVVLDEPGDIGLHFIVKGNYTSLKPARFVKEMGWAGKIV